MLRDRLALQDATLTARDAPQEHLPGVKALARRQLVGTAAFVTNGAR